MLLLVLLFFQDVPQPPPITTERIYADAWLAQVRVNVCGEYAASLQQLVKQLQQETAELKKKCGDRCEKKD